MMTEDQLEQETLGWLGEVGYGHLYGPDIRPVVEASRPGGTHTGGLRKAGYFYI